MERWAPEAGRIATSAPFWTSMPGLKTISEFATSVFQATKKFSVNKRVGRFLRNENAVSSSVIDDTTAVMEGTSVLTYSMARSTWNRCSNFMVNLGEKRYPVIASTVRDSATVERMGYLREEADRPSYIVWLNG